MAIQGTPVAGKELACANYTARYIEIVVTVYKNSFLINAISIQRRFIILYHDSKDCKNG